MRGATCGRCIQKDGQHDISIHAPHARSDDVGARLDRCMKISIHAPHARSDELQPEGIAEFLKISIHAPHARSDLVWTLHKRLLTFQSTLLMRGATVAATAAVRGPSYFNPRSSCEERQLGVKFVKRVIPISIHAPHARSDCGEVMRGWMLMSISIHAPHARSDSDGRPMGIPSYISIHAPHARSDDAQIRFSAIPSEISIHAPHARSDRHARRCVQGIQNFNPRSSCEERRSCSLRSRISRHFNPRSSCEERLCWRSIAA